MKKRNLVDSFYRFCDNVFYKRTKEELQCMTYVFDIFTYISVF